MALCDWPSVMFCSTPGVTCTELHSLLWLIILRLVGEHTLFSCSSVDGRLGCFSLLAVMNSTAVNL